MSNFLIFEIRGRQTVGSIFQIRFTLLREGGGGVGLSN
jgi:hypothetical protein